MIRAFFALSISEQAEIELLDYSASLKAQLARSPVRWVQPENFHITLAFLGDIQQAELNRLESLTEQVAEAFFPVDLQLSRLAWLPSPDKPKALVIEPEEQPELMRLQSQFVRLIRDRGFSVDNRRYRPHLTLARCQKGMGAVPLDSISLNIETPMDEVVLYASQLTPAGAQYTPLFAVPLFSS